MQSIFAAIDVFGSNTLSDIEMSNHQQTKPLNLEITLDHQQHNMDQKNCKQMCGDCVFCFSVIPSEFHINHYAKQILISTPLPSILMQYFTVEERPPKHNA